MARPVAKLPTLAWWGVRLMAAKTHGVALTYLAAATHLGPSDSSDRPGRGTLGCVPEDLGESHVAVAVDGHANRQAVVLRIEDVAAVVRALHQSRLHALDQV